MTINSGTNASIQHNALRNDQATSVCIKVYLSAICHMHILSGLHENVSHQFTPQVQLAILGIKRSQAVTSTPRARLPITMEMMQKIKHVLSQYPSSYDNVMACCLAFFGFLRVSEFTVPTQQVYEESTHLSLRDISVDNRFNPHLIKLHIKQSKTDPFRQGIDIYLEQWTVPSVLFLH